MYDLSILGSQALSAPCTSTLARWTMYDMEGLHTYTARLASAVDTQIVYSSV